MKFIDHIYGEEEINERVLIELISSQTFQRLKGVTQQGIPKEYYHLGVYSRYEHSLGVLILLRRLNSGIEEQVAGLLHDISHTAFSHVIDWVFGDPTKEDFQDNLLLEIIKCTEIAEILQRHGFNSERIANLKNYSLLEQEIPFICADRLDYALREQGGFSEEERKSVLRCLIVKEGKIMFSSMEGADLFAKVYSKCQREHWSGIEAKIRYFILSSALKEAMRTGILKKEDFMKKDSEIMKILALKGNDIILNNLNLLKEGFVFEEDEKEGILLLGKERYVDPEVYLNGSVKRLSEISLEYGENLKEQRKENARIIKVKVLPR